MPSCTTCMKNDVRQTFPSMATDLIFGANNLIVFKTPSKQAVSFIVKKHHVIKQIDSGIRVN